MSQIDLKRDEISITRQELKNLRQEVIKLKAQFKSQFDSIHKLLKGSQDFEKNKPKENPKIQYIAGEKETCFPMKPVGIIHSCFKNKNGIPRQPSLCKSANATLEINKTYFTNPGHSLIGLEQFSYIWILFYFHKNSEQNCVKAKVHPPRLDGASVGVFSTRSPHRPCAIGLSLVKLEKISGHKLHLSGVDILDGTPVLDIKPYIEIYDSPQISENNAASTENSFEKMENYQDSAFVSDVLTYNSSPCFQSTPTTAENHNVQNKYSCKSLESQNLLPSQNVKDLDVHENIKTSNKIQGIPNSITDLLNEPVCHLNVIFTTRAESDIEKFHTSNHSCKCEYCLDFIDGVTKAKSAIAEVLTNDPRSVYRRNKCSDRLYYFEIDKMHVTCWFERNNVEILRIKPVNKFRTYDNK